MQLRDVCFFMITSNRPMAFLTDLATNASVHGIPVVLYSGNEDSLVAHRGTEGAFLLFIAATSEADMLHVVVIQVCSMRPRISNFA